MERRTKLSNTPSNTPSILTTGKLWTVFMMQANEGYQINVLYPFVVKYTYFL